MARYCPAICGSICQATLQILMEFSGIGGCTLKVFGPLLCSGIREATVGRAVSLGCHRSMFWARNLDLTKAIYYKQRDHSYNSV
jgi:hypothetical protein